MLCRGGSSDLDKDIVQRWPKRFKVLDVAEFPKSTENTGARIVGLELQIDETTIVDRAIDTGKSFGMAIPSFMRTRKIFVPY